MSEQKNDNPTPQETALATAQDISRGRAAVIIRSNRSMDDFTEEEKRIIKGTLCPKASDKELEFFLAACERMKLDPFRREIHAVKRWNQETGQMELAIQIGIDGLRSQAEDSGEYRGQKPRQWCGKDGVWTDVWLHDEPPYAAKSTILRKGFEPMVAVARYSSYVQRTKDGKPFKVWRENPDGQLAKCSEALGLRMQFPHRTSGLYIPEEMAAAEFNVIGTTAEGMDPDQITQRNNAHLVKEATKSLPSASLTIPEEVQQTVRKAGGDLHLSQAVINERLDDLEKAFREDPALLQPELDALLQMWREQWKEQENARIAAKKASELAGAPKPTEESEPQPQPRPQPSKSHATPVDESLVLKENPWMKLVEGAKLDEAGRAGRV